MSEEEEKIPKKNPIVLKKNAICPQPKLIQDVIAG